MEIEQVDVPLSEPLTKSVGKLWSGVRLLFSLLPLQTPDVLESSQLRSSSSEATGGPSPYSQILSRNFENAIKRFLCEELRCGCLFGGLIFVYLFCFAY